jgi:actin-like ATPase involved in cell morphogenesis
MFIKAYRIEKECLHLLYRWCIPSGITEVEMSGKESCERVNGKEYLIHEPMAAAIGIGDIMQPKGNMIVDIGGTTEIAVILGGIVCDKSVKLLVTTNDSITCVLNTTYLLKVQLKK